MIDEVIMEMVTKAVVFMELSYINTCVLCVSAYVCVTVCVFVCSCTNME